MARPNQRSRAPGQGQVLAKRNKTIGVLSLVVLVVLILALVLITCLVVSSGINPTPSLAAALSLKSMLPASSPSSLDPMPLVTRKASSLDNLLAMNPEQIAQVDIAEMNLLCAAGLPGAENLDIDRCLAMLDQWAAWVKHETDRHLYRFYQNPAEFSSSEGYFQMLMLITVLQQDCGVHYNLERVRNIDFTNAQDLFIHGMVGDGNGGTCASMPVLYTAVARRLGYPVKLVLARAHVFCRWDGPEERFNIEGSGRGLNTYPDDYYKHWPYEVADAEVKANRYLISNSPQEELACFLASRGHCLLDNGRTEEAFQAYAASHRLAPMDPAYLAWAQQVEIRLHPEAFARRGGIPRPPTVYRGDPLAQVKRINAINRAKLKGQERRMPGAPQSPLPPGARPVLPEPYQPSVPGETQRR